MRLGRFYRRSKGASRRGISMTVIAFDGKVLAADRMVTMGGTITESTKIRKDDLGNVFAHAGALCYFLPLIDWYKNGANPKDYPVEKGDEYHSIFIVWDGSQFKTYHDSPYPCYFERNQLAWGRGDEIALGAMLAGATAIRAVEIAAKVCNTCGCGVDYMALNIGEKND